MLPTLALLGRPNVGKSTLFNRLLRKNRAITHDMPGVTRDRIYEEGRFNDVRYALVDTGGLVVDSSEESGFEEHIFEQAREAVEESQVILLVVDGREGLTPLDEQVSAFVRQSNKPVLLLVNKVDGEELEAAGTSEFHALGFEILPVSAEHGYNLAELRQKVADLAQETGIVPESEEDLAAKGLMLAMLGRPNAGKSSMVNALVREDRVIVSDLAGTTRDSVDVTFEEKGERYTFVDTAGVRRKSHITDSLERFSVLRALKSSKKADVTVMVVDAIHGITRQDKRLLDFLLKESTPFIVAVNKVDLVPSDEMKALKDGFARALRIAPHVPVIYTSTITKAGLGGLLPLARKLKKECSIRTTTGQLNRVMKTVIERQQPPVVKRRRAKFYYLTQSDDEPPTFVFFVNDATLIKDSYKRFLENRLRKMFNIKMAPVEVVFRSTHKKKNKKK